MSMIPIPTRLFLSSHCHRMTARHRGVEVQLAIDPKIQGLPEGVIEIDFAEGQGEIQLTASRRREMTREEVDVIMALLERMAAAARAVFGME